MTTPEEGHHAKSALELIKSEDTKQMLFGFEVLERSRDRAAVQPLVDYLLDETTLPTRRRLAASALGEIGDPAALHALRVVAHATSGGEVPEVVLRKASEEGVFDAPNLLLVIAKACAQLGDHSLASFPVFLAGRQPSPDDAPEVSLLRELATQALVWVVGTGMIAALRSALKDPGYETRLAAIDALFHFGVAEIVPDLMTLVSDPAVGRNARVRVHDLAGAPLTDKPDELRAWWQANGAALASGCCLRSGAPIVIADVIAELQEPALVPQLLRELRVRTGQDFSSADDPVDAARQWFAANGQRFEAGGLYKSGYRVSLPV